VIRRLLHKEDGKAEEIKENIILVSQVLELDLG
jgi:hypothetical protein